MKPSTLPILCSISLTAMVTAGASHWWSVNQWVSAFPAGPPVQVEHYQTQAATKPVDGPQAKSPLPTLAPGLDPSQKLPPPDPAQKNFYEALVKKMENLQNQNQDLLDQMAETNRDVMKLEFRVDTHSESFRPMPVSDDRPDTSSGDGPGVLPPRAELDLPSSNE